ncbi:GNAT family N-acetyltransferase [Photobacterium leiognathi]|uniref:GNAT family N-acetyltransferase n=1 Tax=Photobacterium leiognathi TaxID=553611 RepID=UPI00020881CE|nr:GNAT family N-acetyltransferase [Photobacterium leiognathi]PSW54169.1 N-acetyltransferase [Photobacterium leiognathi subsp. mandapamensis]GAA03841.1 acetyltransferase family protein [Photobacterium leiognathi subsp. mandapamensis svers.1.1.]
MKLDFELSTPRLILRPFKSADLTDFLTAVRESTADLSPWLEWCDSSFDQHDAHEWINASRLSWQTDFSYEFAIFNRFDDEFIGTVSLSAIIPMTNSANLGYWIRSSYHRQGFATEANIAAVQFAFQMLGLTRLEIVTHIDNYASQKTAKACNAQFECEARNRIFYQNKPLDGLVFSLVPSDLMM